MGNIAKNTPLLQLPRHLMMTPGSLPVALSESLSEDVTAWARLALLLILHTRSGKNSPWSSYLAHLPPFGSLHSTVFWSEEELSFLPPKVRVETEQRNYLMKTEYQAVLPVIEKSTELFGGHISFSEFVHSYATVCSRAWCIDQKDSLAMVPFVDMFNHDPFTETLLSYDDEKEIVEVISDVDHSADSQILISYGNLGNSTLSLDFGFVVPKNPHDAVELVLEIPTEDVLRNRKKQLLHGHSLLTNINDESEIFVLRNAGSPGGRGRGIPHSLRAWARVLSLKSERELQILEESAIRDEGRLARRPLKGREGEGEAEAMTLLQIRVEEEVERREKEIEAIKSAVAIENSKNKNLENRNMENGNTENGNLEMGNLESGNSEIGNLMRRNLNVERLNICLILGEGEIEVLKSVLSWLRPRALEGGYHKLLNNS